jgi:hypothetical protein
MLMDVQALMLPLMLAFVNCFTAPGFAHFQTFVMAHAGLLGLPHCVTEVMRITGLHSFMHWTTPYAFLARGRWSCRQVSQCLLDLTARRLKIMGEIVIAIDDTLVKKSGRKFFGLGYYPDPTDKNPGAHKRRVLGHCWVVAALLWEMAPGKWFGFPLSSLLFVPEKNCPADWPFKTKIELAEMMVKRFVWPARKLILVADNLYAKAGLAGLEMADRSWTLVSRLRSNAALYDPPPVPRKRKPGRPRKRGDKKTAQQLYRRRSKRQKLVARIYGKRVTIEAFVGVVIPSRTLSDQPVLVVIFPQRSKKKMNVFCSTDVTMDPVRLLEIYGARFKIEDVFDEIKTFGGFGDCRQRSFKAIKRHATLTIVSYSLLRLLSVTMAGAESIETEPWWKPSGPPSVTRLRRALQKAQRIFYTMHSDPKPNENIRLKEAA